MSRNRGNKVKIKKQHKNKNNQDSYDCEDCEDSGTIKKGIERYPCPYCTK